MASERVERAEMPPLRVEAEQLLSLLHDDDAAELIRDLDMWSNAPVIVSWLLTRLFEVRRVMQRSIALCGDRHNCVPTPFELPRTGASGVRLVSVANSIAPPALCLA